MPVNEAESDLTVTRLHASARKLVNGQPFARLASKPFHGNRNDAKLSSYTGDSDMSRIRLNVYVAGAGVVRFLYLQVGRGPVPDWAQHLRNSPIHREGRAGPWPLMRDGLGREMDRIPGVQGHHAVMEVENGALHLDVNPLPARGIDETALQKGMSVSEFLERKASVDRALEVLRQESL